MVRYEEGKVGHVCIEENYGLQTYLEILETDCEHLSRLIDTHRLPDLAFARALQPGPAWELDHLNADVPQVGVVDWQQRYPPTITASDPLSPLPLRAARKVLRRLRRWRARLTPSEEVDSPTFGLAAPTPPGMRVTMRLPDCAPSDDPAAVTGDAAPAVRGAGPVPLVWPRISVVTVSYNQCRFLRDCLDSVLAQNYPNLEFIVIDGGSTDGSRELLESYRQHLAHLVIESDRGQSHALNKGFRLATGELLTWLCSDDLLEPGALEAVARIRSSQPCDIVVGGCRVINASGETMLVHYSGFSKGSLSPLSFGDMASFSATWQRGLYFYQPELFFTRDLWIRAGAHVKEHLHYAMDYELFLRFALSGADLYAVHQILAASRQHEDQKTRHELPMYLPTVRRILTDFHQMLLPLVRP
jgi:GT2 family glycosyltransferase